MRGRYATNSSYIVGQNFDRNMVWPSETEVLKNLARSEFIVYCSITEFSLMAFIDMHLWPSADARSSLTDHLYLGPLD